MSGHVLYTLLVLMVSMMVLAAAPGSDDAALGGTEANNTGQRIRMEVDRVEAAPMSEAEPANQSQGRSEPGAGESVAREIGKQPQGRGLPIPPAGWKAYVNPTYGFSIDYPNGFVAQPQDVSRLAHFTPTPVLSIFFMNPTMAAGNLAGIEPPDLEVRVYKAGAVDSLESWLASVDFASVGSGAVSRPYRNGAVNGLKVCQSTMISPGCSVYVLRGGRVYQLTPISQEGEAMIETFALRP